MVRSSPWSALTALPHPQQHAAFLRLWTCKEAVLKCLGSGISFGLDRVEFELSDTGDVGGMCSPPARGEPWQVRALIPDAAHVGALAWRGNPLLVRAFVMQAIAGAAQSG